jgi:hypothetical protein
LLDHGHQFPFFECPPVPWGAGLAGHQVDIVSYKSISPSPIADINMCSSSLANSMHPDNLQHVTRPMSYRPTTLFSVLLTSWSEEEEEDPVACSVERVVKISIHIKGGWNFLF